VRVCADESGAALPSSSRHVKTVAMKVLTVVLHERVSK
jgi:hypothetical protein